MRTVIKGLNYTEVVTHRKGDFLETVQHWSLRKPRELGECGVWRDGRKVKGFEEMREG